MSRTLLLLTLTLCLIFPGMVAARWIDDIVKMEVEATGPVNFSHYNHLDALGKKCTLCHNQVYNIVRSKNPAFSMAEMRKGKSCGACHNGKKAFAVDSDCSSCHPTRDITFKVADGDAKFPHAAHIQMYSCGDCHTGIFIPNQQKSKRYTMEQMAKGKSCGACHDGSTAFTVEDNCSNCHDM